MVEASWSNLPMQSPCKNIPEGWSGRTRSRAVTHLIFEEGYLGLEAVPQSFPI